MNVRHIGRTTAAAIAIGVLVIGCTTSDPPTPTPVPTVSQTPTETAQERQERLAYEAAEKAYRTFRAEYNRVLRAGGAKEPTKIMKATAGNGYLKEVQEVAEAYKGLGYHQAGNETITSIKRGGYSAVSLLLQSCEDTRSVKIINKNGKRVGSGELRLIELELRPTSGNWQVWSGSGEKVNSCG